jgi:hypothetical protein
MWSIALTESWEPLPEIYLRVTIPAHFSNVIALSQIIVIYQVAKAVLANPVNSLRKE